MSIHKWILRRDMDGLTTLPEDNEISFPEGATIVNLVSVVY